MGHLVEGHPLEDTGQPEAVVPVEMGDADGPDPGGRHARPDHLALSAFAWVEEDVGAVPAQQVAVVVAVPGGRLAGRAEGHELPVGHGLRCSPRSPAVRRGPVPSTRPTAFGGASRG